MEETALHSKYIETSLKLTGALASSLGSQAYRYLFVTECPQKPMVDILDGGDKACANYVSRILARVGLLSCAHATIASTLSCMENNGWRPLLGKVSLAVTWWPPSCADEGNGHIDFALNGYDFIGNSSRYRTPMEYSEPINRLSTRVPKFFGHPDLHSEEYFANDCADQAT